MRFAMLPTTVAVPRPLAAAANPTLSSAITSLSGAHQFPLLLFRPLSPARRRSFVIRMGGGPRTYPGGVSKWQWKRMQAKKAKQLLKARLSRERQLYEMRKRAELRAAAAELEHPWEVVERAPNLFSVAADEQLKVLADRFQRPGGFDMWNDRDGPEVFRSPVDGLPSARFFPKGVVHSVKPYGVDRGSGGNGDEDSEELRYDDWIARGAGGIRKRRRRRLGKSLTSGETHGSEEDVIDVKAENLDVEIDGCDQTLTFASKKSRSPRNFNRQDNGARQSWRVPVQDDVAMGSHREMVAIDNGLIDRSRTRGNSQRQRFPGRLDWNEVDETTDYFKKLKMDDGESNSFRPKDNPRNHLNSRRQGYGAQFSSDGAETGTSGKIEIGRMGGNGRYNSGNSMSKLERMTLRPTSELLNREGSYRRKNPMQRGDSYFGRNVVGSP